MEELIVKNSIVINAPALRVWDVLTNPEHTKKYMFGCSVVSNWKTGGDIIWKMIYNGIELIAVKGKITAIDPERFLAYTTFDPNSELPDIPENYLTVTYSLLSSSNITVLNVTQGDYNKVAGGSERYDEAIQAGGWDTILVEIKKVAEEE